MNFVNVISKSISYLAEIQVTQRDFDVPGCLDLSLIFMDIINVRTCMIIKYPPLIMLEVL